MVGNGGGERGEVETRNSGELGHEQQKVNKTHFGGGLGGLGGINGSGEEDLNIAGGGVACRTCVKIRKWFWEGGWKCGFSLILTSIGHLTLKSVRFPPI